MLQHRASGWSAWAEFIFFQVDFWSYHPISNMKSLFQGDKIITNLTEWNFPDVYLFHIQNAYFKVLLDSSQKKRSFFAGVIRKGNLLNQTEQLISKQIIPNQFLGPRTGRCIPHPPDSGMSQLLWPNWPQENHPKASQCNTQQHWSEPLSKERQKQPKTSWTLFSYRHSFGLFEDSFHTLRLHDFKDNI